MIGEAWATGCVDAAISLGWIQCMGLQQDVKRGPHTKFWRDQALREDEELIILFGLFLEATQCHTL